MEPYLKNIILREGDPFCPSLENRVAYQWEREISLLTVWMDRERNRNIFRIVENEIRRAQGSGEKNIHILDVGCAYGNHIFMLNAKLLKNQDLHFSGVELNNNPLRFAASFREAVPGFKNCDFILCNIEEGLCFKDGQFHIVLLSDLIEHLREPTEALKEISRVLRKGGKVILTSPLRNSIFKTVSSVLSRLTFGLLQKRYYEGGTKMSADIEKDDKPEFGYGHISEMNLREYLWAGKNAGLRAVEIIPASIFSGSMFFDRHPFLLTCLMFLEAVHRVLKFKSWAHGIQIVFVKE